jgi:RNA polymerase sigma factor (sigma-70 family)
MSDTDLELLARYTRQHAEDAFAEIVRRHLGLVYSAALRQVRSPQLAEEVTQTAFIDLARGAAKLKPDTVLAAWLYQVTRRTAIDVVRREAGRQLREQIATEMNAMNATAADWAHIEPMLDDAMQALDDTDRAAVLLRYFENRSLREVGATLGTSENAAQKRLGRAVERLREFFAKRGVTVGTSGLVYVISANAVQAAPVGLALTISTAAALVGTSVAATATATATKALAMTTLQKTLIAGTVAAAVGTGIFEAHKAGTLRTEVQTLQQQQAASAAEIQQLTQERDNAARELAATRTLAAESGTIGTSNTELLSLRNEVGQLRRVIQLLRGGQGVAAPTATTPEADLVQNGDEEMRRLGLAASRGDVSALEKLSELSVQAANTRTNANQDTHANIRIAFKVMGEEAGNGDEIAFQALWRATRMERLGGMATMALGQAAGMGNEKALEPLLDPERYLLTPTTCTSALKPAAESGNPRAIEALAAVVTDPKKRALWNMVAGSLEKPAATGSATAIDALAMLARAESEQVRRTALLALEKAALNNQAKATEALRGLGYR